jgi:NADH-ubiquinone oxidoreductase chain 5
MGLLVFAVIGGSLINWLIFPLSFILRITIFIKLLTLIICLIGGLRGYLISSINFFSFNKSLNYYFFSFYSCSMWFIPRISTIGVTSFPLIWGLKILKSLDQGWVEFFGIQQFFLYFTNFSKFNLLFQINNLKIYFIIFVFWIIFLICFIIFL